jgi:hypothetical protein
MNKIRSAGISAGWVLVAFGCLHTALTPLNYSLHTIEAAWFAGTGLMLISSGLLNLVAFRTGLPNVFALRAASIVDGFSLVLGIWAAILLDQPQAYVLSACYAVGLVATVVTLRTAVDFQR